MIVARDSLVARLRATGDPLYVAAATALTASQAEIDRLQERVYQLEAIARLNAETIRGMQRAALEAASTLYRSSRTNGDLHGPVRLTAVLLREDDTALQQRVCESEQTVKTYANAADWLQRESAYLRKIARLLDTAGERLGAVLQRCGQAP